MTAVEAPGWVAAVTEPDPYAHLVRADLDLKSGDQLNVVVTRYPVSMRSLFDRPWAMPRETFLVTDERTSDQGLLPMSDIVVRPDAGDARRWAGRTLRALPGCAIAAARDADGWYLGAAHARINLPGAGGTLQTDAPIAGDVLAAAAYAWMHAGHDLVDIPATMTLRSDEQTATVTVATGPTPYDAGGQGRGF